MEENNKWKPIDVIILILVLVIAISLIGAIIRPFITGHDGTIETNKLIAGMLSSMIAIISIYIGSKLKNS